MKNPTETQKQPTFSPNWGLPKVPCGIRRLCSQTHSKLKGLSGEAYNKLCNTVREFKVRQGELLSITEVESDLKKLKVENEALKEENISLLSRWESLYTELQKAVA